MDPSAPSLTSLNYQIVIRFTIRKAVITLRPISIVNTTVKMWLRISRICLSRDQGGMFGRSMAKVMQLLAMKMRTMKSNQALLVNSQHQHRNLEQTIKLFVNLCNMFQWFLIGRCLRGVHFGAVALKRGEESSKFPIANFCFTFFLHYF